MAYEIAIADMVLSGTVFLLATLKARQPYEPGPGFRLPLVPIQFLSVFAFLVGFVYILGQS